MKIKRAFRSFLLNQPDIAALVGTRIHWQHRPGNGTLPAITYYRVSHTQDAYLDGDNDPEPTVIFTVDCWDAKGQDADDLANVVRAALLAVTVPCNWDGVGIANLLVEDGGTDSYSPDPSGRDIGVSQVSLDVLLTVSEGV